MGNGKQCVLSLIALLAVSIALFTFAGSVHAKAQTVYDLNGTWNCNDGGKYYIRQVGNQIGWYGEQQPINPLFSNIACDGIISGNTISIYWGDVPKGRSRNSGTLTLSIISNNELRATQQTGGFSGTIWYRA